MFCSKCGTQMPDDAKFCPSCGNVMGDTQSEQKQFDVSDLKGTWGKAVANAKESWAAMGQKKATLLAVIAGLLVICMIWCSSDIVSISMGSMGNLMGDMMDMPKEASDILSGISISIKGSLLLGGFMTFLVIVAYLVGIAAIAHPFVTNTAVTKKHLLIAKLAPVFNLGVYAWKLLFGSGAGGEEMAMIMKYLDFGLSGLAWLLLGCVAAIWVLSFKIEKEI